MTLVDTPVRVVLEHKGRHVHTVASETPLSLALDAMIRHRIGSVVVVDLGSVVGVVSERDVIVALSDGTCDPATTLVAEVMNGAPVSIPDSCHVGRALALMTEHRTRHLPVCEGDQLVGLVSIGDLTRWITRTLEVQVEALHRYLQGA